MNKYIMINHGVGASEGWDAYFAMLHDRGHMSGGSALDHGLSITKGVFSGPISPTITGYIVIQARDLETAKEIARQSPVHVAGGTVEVFTLIKT